MARLNAIARSLGRFVMNHAARTLPPEHREWSEAMANEFDTIEDGWAALDWAVGCALAAYKTRVFRRDRIEKREERTNFAPAIRKMRILITALVLAYAALAVGYLVDFHAPRWLFVGLVLMEVIFYCASRYLKKLRRMQ